MKIIPFFIECSEYYKHDVYKQKFLQKLAIGYGAHIIKRKEKYILLTPNGEFKIPQFYSDESRIELENKLWDKSKFSELGKSVTENRKNRKWESAKKNDKIFLIYKYISDLKLSFPDKILLCKILILILFLKFIKSTDVEYSDGSILNVDEKFTTINFFKSLEC